MDNQNLTDHLTECIMDSKYGNNWHYKEGRGNVEIKERFKAEFKQLSDVIFKGIKSY